ncbi:MAG: AMP-binding protein [Acidobacteria bacterium]|nr:AMP-binding protein [Acidobacteriota bacterium]
MRTSVADYLPEFHRLGGRPFLGEYRGYRTVRWSYSRLADTAYRFARELDARRIGKGDRVMLWGANSAAWAATFLGCAHRGAVAVPVDDGARPEFARTVMQQVNAELLVCSRAHAFPGTPTIFFEDLDETVRHHPPAALEQEEIASGDPLEIVFTSGTTAEPKGVVITHGNVLENVAPLEEQIRPYLKYARLVEPIRFLNLLPLSHVFGQFLSLYVPPLLGGAVFFQDSLKPGEVISTIKRERISVLVAVPRMLAALKQKIERDLEDSGRHEQFTRAYRAGEGRHFLRRWWMFRPIHCQFGWKFWALISGGAALERDTEEFWARLGYAVIQGYGLTETTSLVSVNHPFKVGRGSIGKVLAGREVKLSGDGEILVRGGGIAAGYWGQGELRSVLSDQGWYHTGDLGEVDAEGNLFFKGRKKEIIVTAAGMNIYPDDLETVVKKQAQVKDCAVVPLAAEGNAEACAVLILKAGSADPARVVDEANRHLAEYQRIRRWIVWPDEDFPRTATAKPRRAEIAEFARKFMADDGCEPLVRARPLAELISRIARRPVAEFDENTRLDSDLNLSSLDRVELMSALEDRYQLNLSESRFSSLATVADLEKMLKAGAAPRVVYHYPAWVQRWPITWVRFAVHYVLLRPAVFLLGWPRIEGRENLRRVRGPVLVVSNHIGDVDVGFILSALPARLRHKLATATGGEALEALRTPSRDRHLANRIFDRVQWILGVSLLNLFPLPREAGFRDSFAFAGQSVDRGYSILVFPEGHHTTDGKLRPFRSGIGLLANNLGIPVVAMRIDGLFELKLAGKKMARPYQVTVRMSKPISFPPALDPQQIATELRQIVERL